MINFFPETGPVDQDTLLQALDILKESEELETGVNRSKIFGNRKLPDYM